MVDFKYETFIADSIIHGHGRFTKEFIDKGCIVLHIDGNINKNENSSYVNHSLSNNLDYVGNNTWRATRDIQIGQELTMNYLQWITELPF